jgi:hypothetical protein
MLMQTRGCRIEEWIDGLDLAPETDPQILPVTAMVVAAFKLIAAALLLARSVGSTSAPTADGCWPPSGCAGCAAVHTPVPDTVTLFAASHEFSLAASSFPLRQQVYSLTRAPVAPSWCCSPAQRRLKAHAQTVMSFTLGLVGCGDRSISHRVGIEMKRQLPSECHISR